MEHNEQLELEKKYSFFNLTDEEQLFYLALVQNCKEITDSKNKVGIGCVGNLVTGYLKKEDDIVHFQFDVAYLAPNNVKEFRWIEGDIYQINDDIYVDMKVERISTVSGDKHYTSLDRFIVKNQCIIGRQTSYGSDVLSEQDIIEVKIGGKKQ